MPNSQLKRTADGLLGRPWSAASLQRVDYVNGKNSSPVAFLEGLYVEPASRGNGIARALVAAVEAWASGHGRTELASDSPVENVAAHAVHRALVAETERVVYFCRALHGV